ncbi:MAG TPA: DUF6498-containing protein [Methanoregula sp.]|nr:DUF6498-containing protein [Methanoregula sp.]
MQYGMMILHPFSRILSGDFDLTPPIIALLSANLVTMVLAIAGNWEAATVIFIYWAQRASLSASSLSSRCWVPILRPSVQQ